MNKLVIGNLKMNLASPLERAHYLKNLKKELNKIKLNNTELIICPPFVHLENFSENIKISFMKLGAQNIFWEEAGSYTGEISGAMVKSLGAEYVIVGHSERRTILKEDDEKINQKLKTALRFNLKPILCVGETDNERKMDRTAEIINFQIKKAFSGISAVFFDKIVIAYEPVWSVGSDKLPSSNDILEMKLMIKKFLMNIYKDKAINKIKIVYGGSVKPDLINDVFISPQMDGVLVGRESLNIFNFLQIAKAIDSYKNY